MVTRHLSLYFPTNSRFPEERASSYHLSSPALISLSLSLLKTGTGSGSSESRTVPDSALCCL